MRQEIRTISPALRARFFYTVPMAGAKVGMSRAQAYRAAEQGLIPTKRRGEILASPARAVGRHG
jgi:hypothetical protein